MNDIDEIRFSIAMDANGLDAETQKHFVNQFRYRFNNMPKSKGFKYHNVYLLQDYNFYSASLSANILDKFERGYPAKNEWFSPLRDELIKSYSNMRVNISAGSYKVYPLFWFK